MTPRLRSAVLILLSAGAAAVLFFLPAAAVPYAGPDAWHGPVLFDGERAWADMVALATQFPRRWSGGPDRQAAADWLAGVLTGIGLEVQRDGFTAWLGGPAPVTLENLWAVSPGTDRADELVVLAGNYDMAPTSVQAASDTAGHVATILELARVLSGQPHRRTLVFFFPDGEEWGMLGARRFVRTFPRRAQVVAALSIEDLDPGELRALGIDGIGQFRGFAPMWLRALAADAAAREGYATGEGGPLMEWVQRSLLISATDQGPFLEQGIAAIDLGGWTDDAALKARVYHLPEDTVEHMRPASLLAYGRIQERIVRAIDEAARVPAESSRYLRLGAERIVPAGRLLAAQILVFVPLAAALLFRFRGGAVPATAVMLEVLWVAVVLAVLLLWADAVKVLPFAGLLPRLALYPPPPPHPLLTTVLWTPVLVSAAVLAAGTLIAWAAMRRMRPRGIGAEARTSALLLCLAVMVAAGLAHNSFGAVMFLLLPSLLWIWLRPRRSAPGRAVNAALVAAGFLVLVLLFAQYGANLRLGWYVLWYVFLAIAYGQFTLPQVVLTLATAAVAVRLLAVTAVRAYPGRTV